ncbi:hypothetical protein HOLleu_30534 [Holothuria leucospilota]|uniref:DUF4190 domain-containing protein n=1 Tax=Holothuria leucospilota TaxID=206669 RepID=A0A9Q1BKJ3_HOLLE|nr:hypothetical protein HOLleu_30534 [Holothuria leucospilota]
MEAESPSQSTDVLNYATNIPSTENQENAAESSDTKEPTTDPEPIYSEVKESPASATLVLEQPLQTSAPPVPGVVSQSPTTNDYSNTIQSPAVINNGYSPQQNPSTNNTAHNIPETGEGGNVSTPNEPQVHQLSTSRSDFIYLEGPPAPSAPVGEETLQTTAPTATNVVPENPTTNEYSNPTQPPVAINHGYLPQQNPPYNNAAHGTLGTWGGGNVSTPSGPSVYQNPNVTTNNQTIDSYTNATQAPSFVNQSYVPEQQPPPYDTKGNLGFSPGPPAYQQQPWNQLSAPSMTASVVINSQPQPTSSNVVIVNDFPPERNPSQGLATASLVMAIVGIFCCFPSIVCAIVGIVFAALSLGSPTDQEKARTYANISMIFTVIGWVMGFILFIVIISATA